jgi:hypothetical protein
MTEEQKNELNFITKIIQTAKKNGVKRLKMDKIEFEIDQAQEITRARPALKVSKEKLEEIDEKNSLQLEFNQATDDLSTLHVEDPMAYEQALIENAIKDEDNGAEKTTSGDQLEETYYQ